MDNPKNDLRHRVPRKRWLVEESVKRNQNHPAAVIAKKVGIDRRTVRNMLRNPRPAPEFEHPPISTLTHAVLETLKRKGLWEVRRQLRYKRKDSRRNPISAAKCSFIEEGIEILDYVRERPVGAAEPNLVAQSKARFIDERFGGEHIARLLTNEAIMVELMKGVCLTEPKDFLAANIPIVHAAIRLHLDKKPSDIREELRFCFWFLFGRRGCYWVDAGFSLDRLRWHLWKIRSSFQHGCGG